MLSLSRSQVIWFYRRHVCIGLKKWHFHHDFKKRDKNVKRISNIIPPNEVGKLLNTLCCTPLSTLKIVLEQSVMHPKLAPFWCVPFLPSSPESSLCNLHIIDLNELCNLQNVVPRWALTRIQCLQLDTNVLHLSFLLEEQCQSSPSHLTYSAHEAKKRICNLLRLFLGS